MRRLKLLAYDHPLAASLLLVSLLLALLLFPGLPDVDMPDERGRTALMRAASNNHAAVVRFLAEHGAGLEAAEDDLGWTALIWAAKEGHLETVRTLLELGAQLERRDREGHTTLAWAERNGHSEVVRALEVHIKNLLQQ